METRLTLFLVFSLSLVAHESRAAEDAVKWKHDAKAGVWTSPEIGLALRKSIAGFQQKSAEPYAKDGSAFGYFGKHGALTLIIERRGPAGYPGAGDCTPRVRANYLHEMHRRYGKTDAQRSFGLVHSGGGKSGRGIGAVCHFVSFPTFGGMPAYSEIGVILIGDILLEYRYSFVNAAAAEAELDAFLRALGIRKT
jgi:hypothetical protein